MRKSKFKQTVSMLLAVLMVFMSMNFSVFAEELNTQQTEPEIMTNDLADPAAEDPPAETSTYTEEQQAPASQLNDLTSPATNNAVEDENSLRAAIEAAQSGGVIEIGSYIELTSPLVITKAITLRGSDMFGTIITKSADSWTGTGDKSSGSLIVVAGVEGTVNIENMTVTGAEDITLDNGGTAYGHGINVYRSNDVALKNVFSTANSGAGLIVNGSTVNANYLMTADNGWYSVNVENSDNYKGVFNLSGDSVLGDTVQIKSDKGDVTVNASGYENYRYVGTDNQTVQLWSNMPITNTAYTVSKDVKTLYASVTAAIQAVEGKGTVYLAPGTYDEAVKPFSDASHQQEKSVNIVGAADEGAPVKGESVLTNGMYIGYDDSKTRDNTISVKGITFKNIGLTVADEKTVTIENNKFYNVADNAIAVLDQLGDKYGETTSGGSVIVKNNIIDGAGAAGINLRNPYDAEVTGNSIANVSHNGILFQLAKVSNGANYKAHSGKVIVTHNIVTNWDADNDKDGGRAIRIDTQGIDGSSPKNKNFTITENKFTKEDYSASTVDQDIVKITGVGENTVNLINNYWNSDSPAFDTILSVFTDDGSKEAPSVQVQVYPFKKASGEDGSAPIEVDNNGVKTQYATLAEAVAAASEGATVTIKEDITVDAAAAGAIQVTKPMTITADADKKITTKGTESVKLFNIAASDAAQDKQVILKGLNIELADDAATELHVIQVTTPYTTIQDCNFTGKYVAGSNNVTRAICTNAGNENLTVSGCTFTSIRQPGYFEGKGELKDNTVTGTKGFVVTAESDYTITGNNFSENAVDIAIIPNNQSPTNYDAGKLSVANSGAVVENQIDRTLAQSGTFVVDPALAQNVAGDNADQYTLQKAVDGVKDESSTVKVAEGTYKLDSKLSITKPLTLEGLGEVTITTGETPWTSSSDGSDAVLIDIVKANGVTLKNLTVTGAKDITENGTKKASGSGINVSEGANVTLEDITSTNNAACGVIVNSSTVTATNLNTSGNAWGGVNVDKKTDNNAVFNLSGNSTLSEKNPIYSEKSAPDVTVNAKTAEGNPYIATKAGNFTIWSPTQDLSQKVYTLDANGMVTIYPSIDDAVNADLLQVKDYTIYLGEGTYTLDQILHISGKSGFTIDGQGKAILTASESEWKVNDKNNKNLITLNACENVTIQNITLEKSWRNTLNIVDSKNIVLNNVTAKNPNGFNACVVINGSTVKAENLTTSGGIYGIDMASGSDGTAASLALTGMGTIAQNTPIRAATPGRTDVTVDAVDAGGKYIGYTTTDTLIYWYNNAEKQASQIKNKAYYADEKGIVHTYSQLNKALENAAQSADKTVYVGEGTVKMNADAVVPEGITIKGTISSEKLKVSTIDLSDSNKSYTLSPGKNTSIEDLNFVVSKPSDVNAAFALKNADSFKMANTQVTLNGETGSDYTIFNAAGMDKASAITIENSSFITADTGKAAAVYTGDISSQRNIAGKLIFTGNTITGNFTSVLSQITGKYDISGNTANLTADNACLAELSVVGSSWSNIQYGSVISDNTLTTKNTHGTDALIRILPIRPGSRVQALPAVMQAGFVPAVENNTIGSLPVYDVNMKRVNDNLCTLRLQGALTGSAIYTTYDNSGTPGKTIYELTTAPIMGSNGKLYDNLQTAVNEVGNGGTVTIPYTLEGYTYNGDLSIRDGITIEVAKGTNSEPGTAKINGQVVVDGAKDVVMNNISIEATTGGAAGTILTKQGASITVNDGDIVNNSTETGSCGIRMEGESDRVTLNRAKVKAAKYYGIGVRNSNQNVTVNESTVTGWAAIMTSNGATSNPPTDRNVTITVKDSKLYGYHASDNTASEGYGTVTLQENFEKVNFTAENTYFYAGVNKELDVESNGLYQNGLQVRSYDNTIKLTNCQFEMENKEARVIHSHINAEGGEPYTEKAEATDNNKNTFAINGLTLVNPGATDKKMIDARARFGGVKQDVFIFSETNDLTEADIEWNLLAPTGNTIEVANQEELAWVAEQVNSGKDTFEGKTVKLTADIDFKNIDWIPIGSYTDKNSNKPFKGSFDGQEHTISNLTMVKGVSTTERAGLFGYIDNTASELKNVTIDTVNITGNEYLSAFIAGGKNIGLVDNIHVKNVTLTGTHFAGGVVGQAYVKNLQNCTAEKVTINLTDANGKSDGDKAGAIIGQLCEGSMNITDCRVTDSAITGVRDVGGVAGMAQYGNILQNCTVNGSSVIATGAESSNPYAGGVVGRLGGMGNQKVTIYQCSSNGTEVTGQDGYTGPVYGGPAENFVAVAARNTDTGKIYTSIQAAIDEATPGNTIEIQAGTYDEAITLTKAVNLIGPYADTEIIAEEATTVNRPDDSEAILTGGININRTDNAQNPSITISGLKFKTNGIQATGWGSDPKLENVTITDNVFDALRPSGNVAAIHFNLDTGTPAKNLTIDNNRITNVGDPVAVTPNPSGINTDVVEGTTNITDNYIDGTNHSSLQISDTAKGEVTITGNTFKNWDQNYTVDQSEEDGGGRAMRFGDFSGASLTVSQNKMVRAFEEQGLDKDEMAKFTKVPESGEFDLSLNYWNGKMPVTTYKGAKNNSVIVISEGSAKINALPYYIDEAMTKTRVPAEVFGSDGTTSKGQYLTIQEAIDADSTENGDIIQLADGVYTDTFSLSKNVTVKGAENGKSILQCTADPSGNGENAAILNMGTNKTAKVQNVEFNITKTGQSPINFSTAGSLTIEGCNFTGTEKVYGNNVIYGGGQKDATVIFKNNTVNLSYRMAITSLGNNSEVTGNTFNIGTDRVGDEQRTSILTVVADEGTVNISNNIFMGANRAIGVDHSSLKADQLTIKDNQFIDVRYGLELGSTANKDSGVYDLSKNYYATTIDGNEVANPMLIEDADKSGSHFTGDTDYTGDQVNAYPYYTKRAFNEETQKYVLSRLYAPVEVQHIDGDKSTEYFGTIAKAYEAAHAGDTIVINKAQDGSDAVITENIDMNKVKADLKLMGSTTFSGTFAGSTLASLILQNGTTATFTNTAPNAIQYFTSVDVENFNAEAPTQIVAPTANTSQNSFIAKGGLMDYVKGDPNNTWIYGSPSNRFNGGDGTAEKPWQINTPEQLMLLQTPEFETEGKYFKLTNDITVNDWTALAEFEGNFDGNGYSITGNNVNFIDALTAGAKVEKLRFEGFTNLVNTNNGTIESCFTVGEKTTAIVNIMGRTGTLTDSFTAGTKAVQTNEAQGTVLRVYHCGERGGIGTAMTKADMQKARFANTLNSEKEGVWDYNADVEAPSAYPFVLVDGKINKIEPIQISVSSIDETGKILTVDPVGEGPYYAKDIIKLKANVLDRDYLFNGWYQNETLISDYSQYEYTLRDQGSISIIAKYAAKPSIQFSVMNGAILGYGDGSGSVTINGADYNPVVFNGKATTGSSVTLKAKPELGSQFSYWRIMYDEKPISYDAEYTFNATAQENNMVFVAVFNKAATDVFDVTFMNQGIIYAKQKVKKDEKAQPVTNPTYIGKTFVGWVDEKGNNFDLTTPITQNTVLSAKYTDNKPVYTVTVEKGTITPNKDAYSLNENVTVTANTAADGEHFAGWMKRYTDGTISSIVSYDSVYNFVVSESITLIATYSKDVVEEKPLASINQDSTQTKTLEAGENSLYTVKFIGGVKIPENYTGVATGLIYMVSNVDESLDIPADLDKNFIIGASGVITGSKMPMAPYDGMQFTKGKGSLKAGQTVAARIYLTCLNSQGEEVTFYSDVTQRTVTAEN